MNIHVVVGFPFSGNLFITEYFGLINSKTIRLTSLWHFQTKVWNLVREVVAVVVGGGTTKPRWKSIHPLPVAFKCGLSNHTTPYLPHPFPFRTASVPEPTKHTKPLPLTPITPHPKATKQMTLETNERRDGVCLLSVSGVQARTEFSHPPPWQKRKNCRCRIFVSVSQHFCLMVGTWSFLLRNSRQKTPPGVEPIFRDYNTIRYCICYYVT